MSTFQNFICCKFATFLQCVRISVAPGQFFEKALNSNTVFRSSFLNLGGPQGVIFFKGQFSHFRANAFSTFENTM